MTDFKAATAGEAPTTRPDRPVRSWWRALAAGAVVATAVNLTILLAASLADASLVLRDAGGADHPITVGGVVFSSAVPMIGGIVLAILLARLRPGFLRVAQLVGGALALLTVAGPLTSTTDAVTRSALVVMHVVVGVAVVGTLEAIRRRRS